MESKVFIVYRTTNLLNQRYYIGVHNLARPWYKGSGAILKRAIKKYGKEYFERQTLYEFADESSAYQKEAELVTIDKIKSDPLIYNVKPGGRGGRSGMITVKDASTGEKVGYVHREHPNVTSGVWVHVHKGNNTWKTALQIRKQMIDTGTNKHWRTRQNQNHTLEAKIKISNSLRGRKQSLETKIKRAKTMKISGNTNYVSTCNYCNFTGIGPAMRRWHFDNCKLK